MTFNKSAILLLCVLLFGCVANPINPNGNFTDILPYHPNNTANVSNGSALNPTPVTNINTTDISEAHNNFGFNLFHEILNNSSGKNVFVSPTSISLALTMAESGSSGRTRDAMAQVLSIEGINQTDQANQALVQSLSEDPSFQLYISNSIWLAKDFSINQAYQADMKDYYGASVNSLDFSDPGSADIINNWVNNSTMGKIPTIVNPPIDPSTRAFLINAVYFNGNWSDPFDPSMTQGGDFALSGGTTKTVQKMQKHGTFDYLETDQFQGIRLPYGDGSMAMYVILPNQTSSGGQTIEGFAQSVNSSTWKNWTDSFSYQEGDLLLPKFKMSYSAELGQQLIDLGMGPAFSDSADFSGMTNEPVKISHVIHKAYIDVNETGTEAAAVTSVVIGTTAYLPPRNQFHMDVNHPFLFVIADKDTGEILFIGVVNDPSAS